VADSDDWCEHSASIEAFLRANEATIRHAIEQGLHVVIDTAVYASDIAKDGHIARTVTLEAPVLGVLCDLGIDLDISFYVDNLSGGRP